MSMVELLVLGLISESPRHGYDVIREFKERGYSQWSRISEVSVYKALDRLQNRGMIEPLQGEIGGLPGRRTYRITPRGNEHLSDLVYRHLSSEEPLYHDYFLPLEFLDRISVEEASLALEERLAFLKRRSEGIRMLLQATGELNSVPHRMMLEHLSECYQREIAWLEKLTNEVLRR